MFGKGIISLVLLLLLAVYGLTAQAVESNDYRLGTGDTLRIVVFQNPDLTTEVRVSESGLISYPLLGSVELGNLSISEAEKKIARLLKEGKFVQQPQINIVLTQVRGNQVSVLGQVNRPGRYPLETFNIKISDMLALAGGIASAGSDSVILTGTRNGKSFRKEIDIPGLINHVWKRVGKGWSRMKIMANRRPAQTYSPTDEVRLERLEFRPQQRLAWQELKSQLC